MFRGRSLYSFCVCFYLLANKIFTSFRFYDTQKFSMKILDVYCTLYNIYEYGVSMQIKWCLNLLFFPVLPLYQKINDKQTIYSFSSGTYVNISFHFWIIFFFSFSVEQHPHKCIIYERELANVLAQGIIW